MKTFIHTLYYYHFQLHFVFSFWSEIDANCEWSEWNLGECSKSCGTGTRNNTRTKLANERGRGTCNGMTTTVEACNTQSCPGLFWNTVDQAYKITLNQLTSKFTIRSLILLICSRIVWWRDQESGRSANWLRRKMPGLPWYVNLALKLILSILSYFKKIQSNVF